MKGILAFMLMGLAGIAQACGPDTDCMLGDRHYRIAHTEHASNGAIVFAHGYRGSAKGIMRNRNMRRMADEMGLALIAIKSLRDDWAIPNAPSDFASDGSAEFTYLEAVLDDAEARFGLNRARLMLSGFSAGGMMVWEVACKKPDLFAGYAPVAGTFWKEPPAACETPASIVHIHGTSDKTVPLEGRRIGQTRQGNIFDTLKMYRDFGNYGSGEVVALDTMTCERAENPKGDLLEFCTHPGGHSFSRNYLRYAWERLEATGHL